MSSDEQLHPGHHSIRLEHRDYRAPGIYFVTICTYENNFTLRKIVERVMVPSALGQIVRECWIAIPDHFAHANLGAFIIMPNHIHGLIEIGRQTGAQCVAPLRKAGTAEDRVPQVRHGSLGAIIRSFKSAVTKRARVEVGSAGEIWQRNYFERVVRDGEELSSVTRYIVENPMKWEWDRENPNAREFLTPGQAGAQHAAPLQRPRPRH
jgi:putative transposase